jgi:putative membrane protein
MRGIRRLLIVAVLLLVLIAGLLFALQNAATVPLDLLVVELAEQPLVVWLYLSFACGGLAGMLVSSVALVRLQAGRVRLKQRLASCEKQLSELKLAAQKS